MRLRTIGLISTLALGLLAGPFPAEAQQAEKVYRIGRLRGGRNQIAFRQRLRELGYVVGQNLVIEYRSGRHNQLPDLAAELVRLKVDVIVAGPGSSAIRAAQQTTRTIPIVMAGVRVDPVKAGFVESLARPGGDITGLTDLAAQLHPKQLELLKEAFPRISRVAILWPRSQQKQAMKEVEAVGQALGIQIQSVVPTRRDTDSDDIQSPLSAINQERPDGLLVASYGFTLRHRVRIIEFTAKSRLPTIYALSRFVRAGGLMSYGADRQHLYRRAATYVDKILKGAKPGDLPVERPTKFDFVINVKTAKQIGVTIPPEVLLQATKVIKSRRGLFPAPWGVKYSRERVYP